MQQLLVQPRSNTVHINCINIFNMTLMNKLPLLLHLWINRKAAKDTCSSWGWLYNLKKNVLISVSSSVKSLPPSRCKERFNLHYIFGQWSYSLKHSLGKEVCIWGWWRVCCPLPWLQQIFFSSTEFPSSTRNSSQSQREGPKDNIFPLLLGHYC